MKKVISAGIGGYSFQIEEDAYKVLKDYLTRFKEKLDDAEEADEIMQDIESRIAELLMEEVSSLNQVVGLGLVHQIVSQMGLPDGSNDYTEYKKTYSDKSSTESKKLFRDADNTVIGGVCSGLAAYFDIDMVLVRILFFVSLFFGGLGFWIYIILWICLSKAVTPSQKLQMHGIPVTAENLLRYSKQTGK